MIVPLYAAIMAFILVFLSIRTLRLRHRHKVAIGHGSEPTLERATRVHANFCEYVPISLLLLFFFESLSDARLWVHIMCIVLVLGRLLHAYGVSQIDEDFRYRVTGMAMTFTVIISSSIGVLMTYFF